MKIIFFGSDDLAAFCLERLFEKNHDVLACVTQPDRAKGRGLKLAASPVKLCGLRNKVPVLQPERLQGQDILQQLKNVGSDFFVVVAYGKILPKSLLEIPQNCAVNVHASLLPKYRGAAPINWAIINGEKETGVSIIRMNEHMDAGDIILQKAITIDADDTSMTLRQKLTKMGADCLCQALGLFQEKSVRFQPQDKEKITFAPKLTKATGQIDWSKSAFEIHDQVRGLLPWPAAFTHYQGKQLKILDTAVVGEGAGSSSPAQPGEIVQLSHQDIQVMTGRGVLSIRMVHLESSRAMDARSFIAGHSLKAGERFS
jgi:methionyl-tRNA formyltransferase